MALSRVWVGRISKTRDILKTSECPKSIESFRFPKFFTGFITIFDQSSVVKFLYLVKKINKLSFLSYFISTCVFPSYHDDIHWKWMTCWDFGKKTFPGFRTWEIQLLLSILYLSNWLQKSFFSYLSSCI